MRRIKLRAPRLPAQQTNDSEVIEEDPTFSTIKGDGFDDFIEAGMTDASELTEEEGEASSSIKDDDLHEALEAALTRESKAKEEPVLPIFTDDWFDKVLKAATPFRLREATTSTSAMRNFLKLVTSDNDYADLMIRCRNESWAVSRIIVLTQSRVLKDMSEVLLVVSVQLCVLSITAYRNVQEQSPILDLSCSKPSLVKAMIDIMYGRQIDKALLTAAAPDESLAMLDVELYELADKYNAPGVMEVALERLAEHLTGTTAQNWVHEFGAVASTILAKFSEDHAHIRNMCLEAFLEKQKYLSTTDALDRLMGDRKVANFLIRAMSRQLSYAPPPKGRGDRTKRTRADDEEAAAAAVKANPSGCSGCKKYKVDDASKFCVSCIIKDGNLNIVSDFLADE